MSSFASKNRDAGNAGNPGGCYGNGPPRIPCPGDADPIQPGCSTESVSAGNRYPETQTSVYPAPGKHIRLALLLLGVDCYTVPKSQHIARPRVDFMTRIFCSLRIWQPQSRSHQQMPPGKRNMTLEAPPVWITALVLVLFVLFPIGISLLGLKQIFKVHRFRKGAVRVIGTVVDIKETTRCLQPPNTISSAAANTQSW
ncbi:hypothetical protein OEG84_02395 [Hoeflea sp. G2-23]|uniref:Uncharacterized protein n=1 Tax=Hoeflea algicola TaxID=2983763 RepID=A0ABT3Z4F4_9HYPH|nr:hypothetical protein [Hoeflea algicola]MCY0146594.1 hypothetical protein [Hoeflea algicola]